MNHTDRTDHTRSLPTPLPIPLSTALPTALPDMSTHAAAWRAAGAASGTLAREAARDRRALQLRESLRVLLAVASSLGVPLRDTPPATGVALTEPQQRQRLLFGLSSREMQVLRGMSEGKSNAMIARELHIAEDTVKTHARRMFKKVGARDRAHSVAIAFRTGLIA
ncbi:DNA-binding NarL/FixJ family response regulator [Phytomonospora endophytica]|uniref:DNA-binding NarL/FixJ family response regulator n=1 Tax=Phytomonospora endophytica TaxID=714109 RepID=A0A841F872_9ACTN|nr:DNA-binding NarL/FixJ family response regulator [Phytomonospora endophytica]GIG65487.1 hypothetical protein Pen01_17820 [Phytomonospora endophytica]